MGWLNDRYGYDPEAQTGGAEAASSEALDGPKAFGAGLAKDFVGNTAASAVALADSDAERREELEAKTGLPNLVPSPLDVFKPALEATRDFGNEIGDAIHDSMSDEAKARLGAGWTSQGPGQKSAWDAPISTAYLQLSRMAGPMAASVTAAGAVKTTSQRLVALAATGAAQNSGELANNVYTLVARTPEKELKKYKPYADLLEEVGGDSKEARKRFRSRMLTDNMLPVALAGGLGNIVGVERILSKIGVDKAIKGRVMAAVRGGLEEAAGEGLQTAAANVGQQKANIAGGMQDEMNWAQFWAQTLEGVAVGTAVGSLVGGTVGEPGDPAKSEPGAQDPDPAQAAAIEEPAPAPTPDPEPTPEEIAQVTPEVTPQPQEDVVDDLPSDEEIIDDLEPEVEDTPTRESRGDVEAQISDLDNPDSPRAAVFVPESTLESLHTSGQLTGLLDGRELYAGVGGGNNLLVLRDATVGDDIDAMRAEGSTEQEIIGALTGSGDGKTAGDTIAVEKVDENGNVVQGTAVRPEEADAAAEDLSADGSEVVVQPVEDALQAREDRAAAEDAPSVDIDAAVQDVNTDPTEAQKESGNYKKAHVKLQGLDITIENPKGSTRSGKDEDGNAWSVEMPAHYGYVKKTEGADGDQVDVYIGDNPDSDAVFVVDQIDNKTGAFDEHKVILGEDTQPNAIAKYEKAFNDGSGMDRIGGVTQMSVAEFKTWLKDGNQKKPTRILPDLKAPELDRQKKIDADNERAAENAKRVAVKDKATLKFYHNNDRKVWERSIRAQAKAGSKSPSVARAMELINSRKGAPNGEHNKAILEKLRPLFNQDVELRAAEAEAEAAAKALAAAKKPKPAVTPEVTPDYEAIADALLKESPAIPLERKPGKAGLDFMGRRLNNIIKEAFDKGATPKNSKLLASMDEMRRKISKGEATAEDVSRFHANEDALLRVEEDIRIKETKESSSADPELQNSRGSGKKSGDDRPAIRVEASDDTRGDIPAKATIGIEQKPSEGPASAVRKVTDFDSAEYIARLERSQRMPGSQRLNEAKAMLEVSSGSEIDWIDKTKAKDLLQDLSPGRVQIEAYPEAMRQVYLALRKKLHTLVPEVDVVMLSDADMDKVYPPRNKKEAGALGVYEGGADVVILRESVQDSPELFQHVVMHELTHAAYANHLRANPSESAKLDMLHDYLQKHYGEVFEADVETSYAMYDPHELLSEAFSNPEVQSLLMSIQVPTYISRKLGIEETRKFSVWGALMNMVRKAIGLPKHIDNAFEGVMSIANSMNMSLDAADARTFMTNQFLDFQKSKRNPQYMSMPKRDPNKIKDLSKSLFKLTTFHQLAQKADKYFGGSKNNPIRKIATLTEKQSAHRSELMKGGDSITREMFNLQKKYAGAQWDGFTKLMHDATMLDFHPDVDLTHKKNQHLGKDAAKGWQAKANHAKLSAEWKALPQDLKTAWQDSADFYRETQNKISLKLIENIVEVALGKPDLALAGRIHQDTATEADYAKFKSNATLKTLTQSRELKEIKGVYFPLIRRGDFVTRGEYDMSRMDLMGGKLIEPDLVQFTAGGGDAAARRAAMAFVQKSDLRHIQTIKTYVDKNDTSKKLDKEDVDSIVAYRVRMQTQHVEFHDTAAHAEAARVELAKTPDLVMKGVEPREDAEGRANANLQSSQMKRLQKSTENTPGFKSLTSAQQAEVRSFFREGSLRLLGSTRAQSRRQARRNVLGASQDATTALAEYNLSTAGYIAKLEAQPEIDKEFEKASQFIKDNEHDDSNLTNPRKQILMETQNRVTAAEQVHQPDTPLHRAVSRVLTASFLDKLASPAYHIINMAQTAMVSAPTMAGRHGWARTSRELQKAYAELGATKTLFSGAKETAKVIGRELGNLKRFSTKGEQADLLQHGVNYLEDAKKAFSKAPDGSQIATMLDEVAAAGGVDPHAGMEVDVLSGSRTGKGNKVWGAVDTTLGRADNIARQIGLSVEALNRIPAAVAAYRMEMARTGDVEASTIYATDIVNNTHFNYSQSNAAPAFQSRHPLARMALQFRKYSQGMVYLMSRNYVKMTKGETPEVKREGAKQLAYLFGTHSLMAGALGLPTEAFRMGVTILNQLGLLEDDWEDIERWVEDSIGEIPSRGLPRAIGIDVSQRMGLQDLITMGVPRGDKKDDWLSWIAKTGLGAPGGIITDWASGMSTISGAVSKYADGDSEGGTEELGKAFEKLVPIKVVADTVKAYKLATEGKTNSKGEQVSDPTGAYETGLQAIGFRPARIARDSSEVSRLYSDKRKRETARRAIFDEYKAGDAGGRRRALEKMRTYNKSVPSSARISHSDLIKARRRSQSQKYKSKGVYVGKRDKDLIRE